MRATILAAFLSVTTASSASVVHVPLKSGLVLQPNQSYILSIDAAGPVEIGWQTANDKPCPTNCIEASDLLRRPSTSFATSLGGSKEYAPVAGRVSVQFTNLSTQPVTIDVYRVRRTCDAEACKFIDKNAAGRALVFKIASFKSITTSKDRSYSIISGTAMSGRPFTVRAIWWSDDKNVFNFHCDVWIKRWLDNNTPPEKYRPYVLSGQSIGNDNNLVLKSIDSCVPNAPHFGILSEASVFK
jgi:hypothetical protein